MKRQLLAVIISALLILLFFYTGLSKLLNLDVFKMDMNNQPFPLWMVNVIVYTLPATECIIALLLFFDTTRQTALWASAVLMLLFTLYSVLVLLNVFGRTPCGCGGVIRNLSWPQHLVLNMLFTFLSIIAIKINSKINTTKIFHGHEKGDAENPLE